MGESPSSAKTHVEIPYGLVEYTANFKKPVVAAFSNSAQLVDVVLEALSPFGFKIDGVEFKVQAEKISERLIVFRRNPAGASFAVGVHRLLVSVENLDWSEAERFISAMEAGMAALKTLGNYEVESQQLTLAMHVQFKDKSPAEITTPLLTPLATKLMDGPVKTHGVILYREKATLIIDGSGAFANAIFVRIVREHRADSTLAEMAERLRKDEENLFDALNLTGVL
jgi:hypothetical protein